MQRCKHVQIHIWVKNLCDAVSALRLSGRHWESKMEEHMVKLLVAICGTHDSRYRFSHWLLRANIHMLWIQKNELCVWSEHILMSLQPCKQLHEAAHRNNGCLSKMLINMQFTMFIVLAGRVSIADIGYNYSCGGLECVNQISWQSIQ